MPNVAVASSDRVSPVLLVLAALAGCAAPETPNAPPAEIAPPRSPAPETKPEASRPAPTPIAVPKAPRRAEPPAVAVAKPAAVATAEPEAVKIEVTILFEFRKAELTADAKARLDRDVVARFSGLARIDSIILAGHTDPIASQLHNIRLSRARALAVREYLVGKGASASNIAVFAFGETQPVKDCPNAGDRQQLIECLAPNRRVMVEVRGRLNREK